SDDDELGLNPRHLTGDGGGPITHLTMVVTANRSANVRSNSYALSRAKRRRADGSTCSNPPQETPISVYCSSPRTTKRSSRSPGSRGPAHPRPRDAICGHSPARRCELRLRGKRKRRLWPLP